MKNKDIPLDDWLMTIDLDSFIQTQKQNKRVFKGEFKKFKCPKFSNLFISNHVSVLNHFFTCSLFKGIREKPWKPHLKLIMYFGNLIDKNQFNCLEIPCFQAKSGIWKEINACYLECFFETFETDISRSQYNLNSLIIFTEELKSSGNHKKANFIQQKFELVENISQVFIENSCSDKEGQKDHSIEKNKKQKKTLTVEQIHKSMHFYINRFDICIYQLIEIFYQDNLILPIIVKILASGLPNHEDSWKFGISSYLMHRFPDMKFDKITKKKLENLPPRMCRGPSREFGPLNPNSEMKLPLSEEQVIFIGSVEDLKHVDLNSQFISISLKSKTSLIFNKNLVSIIQIATESKVFILDLLVLNKDPALNEFLTNLFSGETIKLGVPSTNILQKIKNHYPHLESSVKNLKNFIDISSAYKRVYLKNCSKISDICEDIFGIQMSEFENKSNWENRPLRKSQLHHAALEVFISIEIFKSILINSQLSLSDFFLPFNGKINPRPKVIPKKKCKICDREDHLENDCIF